MGTRAELSSILNEMIAPYVNDKKHHVFFQSPASYLMTYPAIIYTFDGFKKLTANNGTYKLYHKYEIKLITSNPDSELIDQLESLTLCELNRSYVSDNLYHYSYTLYF